MGGQSDARVFERPARGRGHRPQGRAAASAASARRASHRANKKGEACVLRSCPAVDARGTALNRGQDGVHRGRKAERRGVGLNEKRARRGSAPEHASKKLKPRPPHEGRPSSAPPCGLAAPGCPRRARAVRAPRARPTIGASCVAPRVSLARERGSHERGARPSARLDSLAPRSSSYHRPPPPRRARPPSWLY